MQGSTWPALEHDDRRAMTGQPNFHLTTVDDLRDRVGQSGTIRQRDDTEDAWTKDAPLVHHVYSDAGLRMFSVENCPFISMA